MKKTGKKKDFVVSGTLCFNVSKYQSTMVWSLTLYSKLFKVS